MKKKRYTVFVGKRGSKWMSGHFYVTATNIAAARNKAERKIPFNKTIKKIKRT